MAALAALPAAKPDLMDGAQRSQNRELMAKNRIEGRHGAMSWAQHNEIGGLPAFLSGHASLHFPPPENEMRMAASRQAHSTDEGPNQ